MTRIDCDVLIVGSGAAGGVLAATLARETDLRIVLTEKGGYFGREFFNQREWDMRVLFAEGQARTTAEGSIPVRGGECVGGGTTVNFALCFDPVRSVWDGWKRARGLEGFSFDDAASDWDIAGLNMPRALRDVRRRLNVHPPRDDEINDNNRAFARGCEASGVRVRKFELNMVDCIGCGYCGEGCAYDRKQGTMITYVADALDRGVQLVHHCRIERLAFARRGGRLTATAALGTVAPTQRGSRANSVAPGPIDIRANLVIVSAGAIESPLLLARSEHPDPARVIGRGLVLHPSLPLAGRLAEPLKNYRGLTGAYYSDHFSASHGFVLECLFGHPVYSGTMVPGIGPQHFESMLNYGRAAGFGVMLIDSVQRTNRVVWDRRRGTYDIVYRLSDADRDRMRYGAERAVEIMFAAGAEEVVFPSEEPIGPLAVPRFRRREEARYCAELQFTPHLTTITSAHCQATVKMGEDPIDSVIDSRGESHHVANLIVCDSSVFPTSCGANPMLSVMTLARYQGLRIAAEYDRYLA